MGCVGVGEEIVGCVGKGGEGVEGGCEEGGGVF